MLVGFYLSMPTAASWNGKWSGEGRLFARVYSYRNPAVVQALVNRSYYYRWSDGWCACVEMKEIDRKEANRIRRKSQGFSGYDWMIDSILARGKILTDHEIKEEAASLAATGAVE